MQKQYEYRVYSIDGTFKQTIPRNKILREPRFVMQINGTQWALSIWVNTTFWDTTFQTMDVVRVFEFDTVNHSSGIQIYSWVITRVRRMLEIGTQSIEYETIGIGTLLNFVLFNQSSSYIFSKNQDPSTTFGEIITYFNTQYTANWLSDSSTSLWSSINYDFSHTKCYDGIREIAELTTYYWYIDRLWSLKFATKPSTATHFLTVWKDIENIQYIQDSEQLVNRHILTWKSGTKTTEDATSISSNGLHELFESKTEIGDLSSATIAWQTLIDERKDDENRIKITVNNNYDIESIEPGHTVTVWNTDIAITNLQINKVEYNVEKAVLHLERFDNFTKEIFSNS